MIIKKGLNGYEGKDLKVSGGTRTAKMKAGKGRNRKSIKIKIPQKPDDGSS